MVGKRFTVPGPTGAPVEVTVENGVVMAQQREAWCVVCSDDQQRFVARFELTREELKAYSQHPATFFGVIDHNAGRPSPKTPLDWFDFFWESYAHCPKEKLIELMAAWPEVERFTKMTQQALATEYCISLAAQVLQKGFANTASMETGQAPSPTD